MKKRCTAIVLAAGSGKRMNSSVSKQFILLDGKPLIYYALHTMEESAVIDDVVLVTAEQDIDYMQREIVEAYGLKKVQAVIAGGRERWESVAFALSAIKNGCLAVPNKDGYVFIQDGARPFLTEEILEATYEDVQKYHACVAGVPAKDTIKLTGQDGFINSTPDRRDVWVAQTPQVFETQLITSAYATLQAVMERQEVPITDDASVLEGFSVWPYKIKMTMASYTNIKITTREDLIIAETLLRK